MGRSSSTGFPFLVVRPDGGQFTYHRTVALSVASFVAGEIGLDWSGRSRPMSGKPAVKISLGTGDIKTARQRWVSIHAQVDSLVQLAELLAKHPPTPKAKSETRLDAATVRTMAGQVYHDVLAADDEGQIGPGAISAVARIVLNLAERAGVMTGADHPQVVELAARKIEQRLALHRLKSRATAIVDRPILESELDAAVLGSLPKDLILPRFGGHPC